MGESIEGVVMAVGTINVGGETADCGDGYGLSGRGENRTGGDR